MPLIPFTKTADTYSQQLQKLKDRGLIIESDDKVLHLLEKLSYYRLSGYWHLLLDEPKSAHLFKKGANFQTAFELYRFDRDLRIFILKELGKIEVAIRAQMIYHLSHSKGVFWLSDVGLFIDKSFHKDTIKKLIKEVNKSDEEFLKAFLSKYSDPLPPSWMTLEISSFGALSTIYSNLNNGRTKRNIANAFGLNDSTFASWMHCLVYIRNVCAHHSRLWNRAMRIKPMIPGTPKLTWLNNSSVPNNKTYYILCMMLYLLQSIDTRHQFIFRIKLLLNKYPCIDSSAMGFPAGWEKESLWSFKPSIKQWLRLNMFHTIR